MPRAPVYALIEAANRRHLVTPDTHLCKTTVYRFLHRRGLMSQVMATSVDRRKFEAEFPNDMWQSDVMHGIHVPYEGKLRKTYLIAFIDDHSRLIPYGAFFFSAGDPYPGASQKTLCRQRFSLQIPSSGAGHCISWHRPYPRNPIHSPG